MLGPIMLRVVGQQYMHGPSPPQVLVVAEAEILKAFKNIRPQPKNLTCRVYCVI